MLKKDTELNISPLCLGWWILSEDLTKPYLKGVFKIRGYTTLVRFDGKERHLSDHELEFLRQLTEEEIEMAKMLNPAFYPGGVKYE